MKRFFVFLLLGMVISTGVMAQQVKTRKVPYLPYAGMAVQEEKKEQRVIADRKPVAPASTHKTVYFDKDSSTLRPDQAKKLVQIGKWLEKEGGACYYIHVYTTPEISTDLAKKRGDTVIQSLADFRVGEPVVQPEYRKSPVVNPNRVEIYLNPTTASLGTASTKYGKGPAGTASSNFTAGNASSNFSSEFK